MERGRRTGRVSRRRLLRIGAAGVIESRLASGRSVREGLAWYGLYAARDLGFLAW